VTTAQLTSPRELTRDERQETILRWLDLTRVLAWKNFRQRYLRSRLGVIWALLQPTLQAAVLSVVFVVICKVKRVPHYPVFVLSGIMSWQFFSNACSMGTTSIVDNAALVRKVAVPKVIFPVSAVGGVVIVYVMQVVVLLVGGASVGALGRPTLLLLLAIPLEAALGAAVGVLCASIYVTMRDIRFIIDSALMMGFYLTPVMWDINRLPDSVRPYMAWNPMYGVLSLVRAAVVGMPVDWTGVLSASILTLVIAAIGGWLFHRRSPEFADLV
jgi:ABC-type polysaccharide/polyol phosphate export permease